MAYFEPFGFRASRPPQVLRSAYLRVCEPLAGPKIRCRVLTRAVVVESFSQTSDRKEDSMQ
jgi:hypothetical protein